MTRRTYLVVAALVLYAVGVSAQAPAPKAPPATEIFLASFKEGEKKTFRIALLVFQNQGVKVGKPVKITNKPADDYRPSFLPDSSGVVFASSRDGSPDSMRRYDIATKVLSELGTTPGTMFEQPAPAADSKEKSRTPAGSRIWGENSRLLIRQEGEDHWIQIADLSKDKVGAITRVVVSPDGNWIAIVATAAAK
jgi:Tol biopolymer transport system component